MSKKYNIRWRDSDLQELERTIKNFNSKVRYHKNKGNKDAQFLPDTQTKTKALQEIKTRADYNRYIKSLQRFSEKGAETVLKDSKGNRKTTKWAWEEYKRKEKAQNMWKARERKRIAELPQKSRGQEVGYNVRMDTEKMNSLKPTHRTLDSISSHYEFERFTRTVDNRINQAKLEEHFNRVKENYITSMRAVGIDGDIIDYIEELDGQTISDTMMIDTEASITFVYSQEELTLKNESLRNVWKMNKEE